MKLPIDSSRDEFLEVLRQNGPSGRLVLSAPTGSGKSTRVPQWCRAAKFGPVLVIEPRRIACRTLSEWVAQSLRQKVGETVGYSVRYEQCYSDQTEILFVTPGVARLFLLNGTLAKFPTIVFDEFHERSWETDTLMALLAADPSPRRLILMSATLSADRLTEIYQTQRIEGFSRSFPVEIVYRGDASGKMSAPSSQGLTTRTVQAVRDCWSDDQQTGSILVFLPGLASMREIAQRLQDYPVKLLHGTFANRAQDSAFSNQARRVVLATNVAESSLTVPGITTVIDSGLEKRPIHQSGYVALATVPISRSSADQRAGRAGRTQPGRCLRLWEETARLNPDRAPDLEGMELDELVMFLASLPMGCQRTPLRWLDPPPDFAWERALRRLQQNRLIDDDGRATPLGLTVSRLPVDSQWARLLALAPNSLRSDLCDLHAASHGRRSFYEACANSEQAEQRKQDLGEDPWRRALALLRIGDPVRHGLDREALSEARRLSRDLKKALGMSTASSNQTAPHSELGMFLAQNWPERHFVKRKNREAWANGQVECRIARGEELPDDCQAAIFLQVEPVISNGLKVELRGRGALPTTFSLLRRAGYGEPELEKIRWQNGQVAAKLVWNFGGRTLGTQEEALSGAPLRQALSQLFRSGRWMKGAWEQWEEQEFYGQIRATLQDLTWSQSAEQALEQRLADLGIEASADLELLGEDDLRWNPVDSEELVTLKKQFPQEYSYGGVSYQMSYHPKRRRVVMTWTSGPKNARPNSHHLPRWNGWAIDIDERGRVTPVRR